jgi:hypothetical protein
MSDVKPSVESTVHAATDDGESNGAENTRKSVVGIVPVVKDCKLFCARASVCVCALMCVLWSVDDIRSCWSVVIITVVALDTLHVVFFIVPILNRLSDEKRQ